jgi:hypothetical protein
MVDQARKLAVGLDLFLQQLLDRGVYLDLLAALRLQLPTDKRTQALEGTLAYWQEARPERVG